MHQAHMDFKLGAAIRMLLHVCHPGASVCVGVKVELSPAFIVFARVDKYCSCAPFIPAECKLQLSQRMFYCLQLARFLISAQSDYELHLF
jgi:hypothetical protein